MLLAGFWDAIRGSLTLVELVLLRWPLVIMSNMVERQRVAAIEYLIAENRVLRAQLGERRLGLKGRVLDSAAFGQFGSLASPGTILGWYRSLIAHTLHLTISKQNSAWLRKSTITSSSLNS